MSSAPADFSRPKSDVKITFRPLARGDYDKGFPAILSQLTDLGAVSREQFERCLDVRSRAGASVTLVGEDEAKGRIACTASLFYEAKFIHNCGLVAHIEDVVVDSNYRGLNLGKIIIERLVEEARAYGCYKIILDCNEKNVAFYEQCGFSRRSVHMAFYYDEHQKPQTTPIPMGEAPSAGSSSAGSAPVTPKGAGSAPAAGTDDKGSPQCKL